MKHYTASARMRLLAVPLVQPHPPPSPHKRRLCRCVRSLQAVPQCGVLRVCESVGSVCLQCRKLPYQCREVAGRILGYILWVLWAHYEPTVLRHHRR